MYTDPSWSKMVMNSTTEGGTRVAKEVLYLHFGRQCPGTFLAEQARKTAEVLQIPYRQVDISERPDLAEKCNLFIPGTVFIDDVRVVYGTSEQMLESYRLRGPIPGTQSYEPKPGGQVERVEHLTDKTCGVAFRSCIPSLTNEQEQRKTTWLGSEVEHKGFTGILGWSGEEVVGFVEALPEKLIPYPIGQKSSDSLFITCLYSPIEWGLDRDYRVSLLQQLSLEAVKQGYTSISVISGKDTPYPNGPMTVFDESGFVIVKKMGMVLLRHHWEEAWLMRKSL